MLRNYGEGQLLIKRSGLSILKRTPLGRFRQEEGDEHRDQLSGLYLQLSDLKMTLFCCPRTACLRVAFMNSNHNILGYLSYENLGWGSSTALALKQALEGESLIGSETCLARCNMWLDDWSLEAVESAKPRHPFDRLALVSALTKYPSLSIRIRNEGLTLSTDLKPSFFDVDEDVVRLSDRSRNNIVYADMSRADFIVSGQGVVISS